MTVLAIEHYTTAEGVVPFVERFTSIRFLDRRAAARIAVAIAKMGRGLFGDWKSVGSGPVREVRINYGPGYRVYYAVDGKTLVILLLCGDKRTQAKDIESAHEYWNDYKSAQI